VGERQTIRRRPDDGVSTERRGTRDTQNSSMHRPATESFCHGHRMVFPERTFCRRNADRNVTPTVVVEYARCLTREWTSVLLAVPLKPTLLPNLVKHVEGEAVNEAV
jgi:hypothetical protein